MAFSREEPGAITSHPHSSSTDSGHRRLALARMAQVMVNRPADLNRYEFIAVCALRAQQLLAGCTPRVDGDHRATTMAQMEVVAGRVTRVAGTEPESK